MNNQLVIITGASSGVGMFTALSLVKSQALVIFACRNENKTKGIINQLPEKDKKYATFIRLDLSDFKSIQEFSKVIKSNYPKIDILMNNAGANPREFIVTKDNIESTLEGNVLGHIYLTYLLMDHFNENSRIINLSSLGQFLSDLTLKNIDDFYDHQKMKSLYFDSSSLYSKLTVYHNTKLLMLLFTQHLADKFDKENKNIKAVCLHPGVVDTSFMVFTKDYPWLDILFTLFKPVWRFFSKTIEEGSQTQLYLSYLDYNQLSSGAYYVDCKVSKKVDKSKDRDLQRRAMELSFKLINSNNSIKITM